MRDDDVATALAELLGTPAPDAAERTAVLDLTRVVAHGVERRFGPVTAYALGLALAGLPPAERAARIEGAARAVEARLADGGLDDGRAAT